MLLFQIVISKITKLYNKEELLGKQIVGVVNFPTKQIGPFLSEFLLTGFYTEEGIVLTGIEKTVKKV